MKHLKWFWKVNYAFSSYRVLVLLVLVVGTIFDLDNTTVFVTLIDYLTLQQNIKPFSAGYELLQLFLCSLILYLYKEQRIRFHFWYLGILMALMFVKVLVFAIMMLSQR